MRYNAHTGFLSVYRPRLMVYRHNPSTIRLLLQKAGGFSIDFVSVSSFFVQRKNMTNRHQISNEDRQRVVLAYIAKQSIADISNILQIKRQTVKSIVNIYNATGRIDKLKRGGQSRQKLTANDKEVIRGWVDDNCSLTLNQLACKVEEVLRIRVCKATIDRALHDFHYSWKRISLQPAMRNDEQTILTRKNYADMYMELLGDYNETQFVFVDEFGVNVSMRSRYGRSHVGTRAVQVVPTLRAKNISVCAAMNIDGVLYFKWQDTAFRGNTFIGCIQEICDRMDQERRGNAIFVVDNASIHGNPSLRQMLNQRGHVLMFLPPYSPFLNPIENLFSKWKESIRSLRVVTEDELIGALSASVQTITRQDCNSYYRHIVVPPGDNGITIGDRTPQHQSNQGCDQTRKITLHDTTRVHRPIPGKTTHIPQIQKARTTLPELQANQDINKDKISTGTKC